MKELRLALVCYGGSSLAIYMHGITKEIHRLVRASALLEAGREASDSGASEQVYWELLEEVAKRSGVRTRVVVDVVAGTSAGGINGVYLAKAVAHDRSQDLLRDLWFTRGDMNELLLGPKWLTWKVRLPLLLPLALRRSPVRGDAMARWLFDALEGMDTEPNGAAPLVSLMPPGHLLELFVTITDFYGYDRQVPIAKPKLVHDSRHRHALTFAYETGGDDNFAREWNGALAFAARTTSSFPGVFPPVSFEAFARWVPNADLAELRRGFRAYALAGADPQTTQFVDGGVLDNKPFGWAIGAVAGRRADVEVDRRLLYLQPDPGDAHHPHGGAQSPRAAPGTISAAIGAASGIPRKEPILDDLLDVEAHNERVRRIREVIETSFAPVGEFVEGVVGGLDQVPASLDLETLSGWNDHINQETIERAGLAYATYVRLKISGTVDRYAETLCDVCEYPGDSNHAMLVRHALRAWAEELGLFERQPVPTDAQRAFLRMFDLGFGERRLRFVTAALRWWYRDLRAGAPNIPPRPDLDRGKQILYDAAELLRKTMGGEDFDAELRARMTACFPEEEIRTFLEDTGLDGAAYVAARSSALHDLADAAAEFNRARLTGFNAKLYDELGELAQGWHPDRRRDLLVRYLGFPLWDVLLYPIQALADAGENDEVNVIRMSPFEARVLKTPPERKVQGTKLNHFWAFFDRKARENDYLWGRLDGAVHLIGLLLPSDDPAHRAWCMRAFEAILAEEERSLPNIQKTVAALREEVQAG